MNWEEHNIIDGIPRCYVGFLDTQKRLWISIHYWNDREFGAYLYEYGNIIFRVTLKGCQWADVRQHTLDTMLFHFKNAIKDIEKGNHIAELLEKKGAIYKQ